MGLDTLLGASPYAATIQTAAQALTVRNATELQAALDNAAPGATIKLAGGNYGDFSFAKQFGSNFTGNVTIVAADPNSPPVFSSIVFNQVSNITLSGVDVQMVAKADSVGWDAAVRIFNASGITIDNANLVGADAINGVSPSSTTGDATGNVLGMPFGNAFNIQSASNITIQNSDISHFSKGIRMGYVDGIEILDNDFSDLRSTPIGGGDVSNIVIDGNVAHSSHPWQLGPGDHGDFIHLWTVSSLNQNITITNNAWLQGDGAAILGIYLDDKIGKTGFNNVVIDNNLIMNADQQGISLDHVRNATVTNNTLLTPDETNPGSAPGIHLVNGSTGVVIDHNVLGGILTSKNGQGSVSTGSNLVVQSTYPDQPNYAPDLYSNILAKFPGLTDLIALPGTIVDTGNYGASFTQPDIAGKAGLTGFVFDAAGTDLTSGVLKLDASVIYDQGKAISTAGATTVWDFGDGKTGTGQVVTHGFNGSGSYDVTATTTLADGRKVVTTHTVEVRTPDVLVADFNGSAADISSGHNAVTLGAGVALASDGGRSVAKMNGGAISYARSPDMFDNTAFTVSIDFRKLVASDTGPLINFPGTVSIALQNGAIQAGFNTSKGTTWVSTGGLAINDTNWHSVAVTFSGTTGRAVLYLDGKEVAAASGLQGAIQNGNIHHDFHIGNIYSGGGFDGYVDNFAFLSGALTATDVQSLHAGTASLSGIIGAHMNTPSFSVGGGTSGSGSVIGSGTGSGSNSGTDTGTSTGSGSNSGTDTGTSTGSGSATDTDDDDTGTSTGSGSATDTDDDDTGTSTGSGSATDTDDDDTGTSTGSGSATDTDDDDTGTSTGSGSATDTDDDDTGAQVMQDDDDVHIPGVRLDSDQILVDTDAAEIGIDLDDDGQADSTVALKGDFSSGEFMTALSPTGTTISFTRHITTLSDQQSLSSDSINGVSNAPYLHGDTSSDFTVTLLGGMAAAGFANSLGVYEYDQTGAISDVRLIADNVQAVTGPIHVTGVDAGKGLGFFIIQNGYDRLDTAVLQSPQLDLTVHRDTIRLVEDGDLVRKAKVFVSHDETLNPDNMQHVVSGADPGGSGGMILAFEDQLRNGGSGDDDFQDVVFLVEAGLLDVA